MCNDIMTFIDLVIREVIVSNKINMCRLANRVPNLIKIAVN